MKHVKIVLCVIGLCGAIENLQASRLGKAGFKTAANFAAQQGFTGAAVTTAPQIFESAPVTKSAPQAPAGNVTRGHKNVPVSVYYQPASSSIVVASNQVSSLNSFNSVGKNNLASQNKPVIDATSLSNIFKRAELEPPVQEFSAPVASREVSMNTPAVLNNQSQLQGAAFGYGSNLKSKLPSVQKQEMKLTEKPVEKQQAPLLLIYDPALSLSRQAIVPQEIVIDSAPQSVAPTNIVPEIVPAVQRVQPGLTQSNKTYAQSAANYYTGNKGSLNLRKSMKNNYSGQQNQQSQSSWQGQRNSPGLDTTIIAPRKSVEPIQSPQEVVPQESIAQSAVPINFTVKATPVAKKLSDLQPKAIAINQARANRKQPEMDLSQTIFMDSVTPALQPIAESMQKYRPTIRKRQNAPEFDAVASKTNNKRKLSDIQSESVTSKRRKLSYVQSEPAVVSPEKFVKGVDAKIDADFQSLPQEPSRWMIIRMLQSFKRWVLESLGYNPSSAAKKLEIVQAVNRAENALVQEAVSHDGKISSQAGAPIMQGLAQDIVDIGRTDSAATENQM